MRVYRITRAAHAYDLSGEGAGLYGGRWNPVGTPLVYCANSTALAALEVRVHIDPDIDLPELARVVIEVPDDLVTGDEPVFFADENASRSYGSKWVAVGGGLCLRVLSAALPPACDDSFNVLINPAHPESGRVRVVEVTPFRFDPRLL